MQLTSRPHFASVSCCPSFLCLLGPASRHHRVCVHLCGVPCVFVRAFACLVMAGRVIPCTCFDQLCDRSNHAPQATRAEMSHSRGNSFPHGIDIHNMGDNWAQFFDQAAASGVPGDRRTFAWDHHIPMTVLAALRTLGLHESPRGGELTIDLPGSSNMEMGALGSTHIHTHLRVHKCISELVH